VTVCQQIISQSEQRLCESRSCSVLTVCGAPVGREEVGAIESWLGHSESIIVYFALMVGARSGISRSKMRGVRPVVSSRQVGGRPEAG
jgi:hypothetical protein